ncbi:MULTISPECIES: HlyD family efflux transporter periplasmic adaptor subunit [Rubrivivax]|uniref:HlyD family efflux transporter periplasmic adaptor subunit n=1 Tax=Rubrivivax benzoatilyticus TaxID=316997 RepID=A0ABX0HSI3_9BURK|nr:MULTISPECIES: HlyD family efflux transporter periplasmic adaptor subunit [Rubrivivax]MCD0420958.1 efflux RND transporter periplasmic adaptor subunit [Rubrivivax sp. JA1024]EGJ10241.1 putative multidrug resistance protein [Rubrivivax benzoatilyticus JA2 = ATCC BAA-35]MCC9595453.1 efflux RND transporter periplasmic adaptor subunit [Rubrivivax sp. JA1055]MCC9647040.1 efflux RND transporter periplasmic adaptor subunit [Rubrivivax sp. JA1029]NHK97982.1 HlyD family efflux transporter periplasmic 
MSEPTSTPAAADPGAKRKPALLAATGITLAAAILYGGWWLLTQRHHESTDNAYVQGQVVQITPQVAGTVLAVLADDTDLVKAGQPLVQLDPADARLALARAEAQLAQTVREVRTVYANDATYAANVRLREAEVARAEAEARRAADDLERRRPLLASGAVGGEEIKHAETTLASANSALAAARSALAAAQEQATANRALTEGTTPEQHPNVERAAAAVREAWLALQRTELPAPITGQVARRSVQVGQRVAPGTALMSVVPLEQVWVEANFKEGQLRDMRIGQPVKLSADLYGSRVEYEGRVAGVGAGTGAAFALLPAQNATGNWIKVVQRVPVRIELDARQLSEHPLRVGLSMEASVDTADTNGEPVLAAVKRPTNRTAVFDAAGEAAERRVHEIIARNLGRPAKG